MRSQFSIKILLDTAHLSDDLKTLYPRIQKAKLQNIARLINRSAPKIVLSNGSSVIITHDTELLNFVNKHAV